VRSIGPGVGPRADWTVALCDGKNATCAVLWTPAAERAYRVEVPARSVFATSAFSSRAAADAHATFGGSLVASLVACGEKGLAYAAVAVVGDECRVVLGRAAAAGAAGPPPSAASRKVAAAGRYVVEARGGGAFRLHDVAAESTLDLESRDALAPCAKVAVCDAGDRGALIASVHEDDPGLVRYLPAGGTAAGR